MLYGVGLAAPTNNCQLNVPTIDPLRLKYSFPIAKGRSLELCAHARPLVSAFTSITSYTYDVLCITSYIR